MFYMRSKQPAAAPGLDSPIWFLPTPLSSFTFLLDFVPIDAHKTQKTLPSISLAPSELLVLKSKPWVCRIGGELIWVRKITDCRFSYKDKA